MSLHTDNPLRYSSCSGYWEEPPKICGSVLNRVKLSLISPLPSSWSFIARMHGLAVPLGRTASIHAQLAHKCLDILKVDLAAIDMETLETEYRGWQAKLQPDLAYAIEH